LDKLSPEYQEDGERSSKRLPDHIHRVLTFEMETFDWMLCKPDGSIFPAMITLCAIQLKGKTHIMAICRDFSERKQIENDLKESKQQLANIIDFLPDAAFVVDNDMKIISWNRAMEEMTGFLKKDMLGEGDHAYAIPFYGKRRKQLLDLLDVSDAELELNYQHIERKGETLYAEVFAPALHNGKGAFLWASGAPLYSTDNKRVGAIEVIRDISVRKKIEEELQHAKLLAEAANRAKSEFLANMSHEIRTPMNAITGISYLALKTDLDPRQRDYVEKIRNAADSLLGIINDVLDFSKIEAGKLDFESIDFSLSDVFEKIGDQIALKAEEKGDEVMFSLSPEIPPLLVGDPLRLSQILSNLVGNAVKFTSHGNIVIAVRPVAPVENGRVTLAFDISDTGIGMDKDQVERIFAPFVQADSSSTRKDGGTGLGLTIAKRLVELKGGVLQVESEPGVGSRFSFVVSYGISSEPVMQLPDHSNILEGMKVLVVDDNQMSREIMISMLESCGLRVTAADSGKAALALLQQSDNEDPYRFILLDYRMPDMNGIETAMRIREDYAPVSSKGTVIMMVTAYSKEAIQQKLEDHGIHNYLSKPVTTTSLVRMMTSVVKNHGIQREMHTDARTSAHASIQDLSGARVLVAEDNMINQQILVELLSQVGIAVECAADGREAVALVASSTSFNAVLMDLQMPVMDGYEATRRIRQSVSADELPIIAITAHAMAKDRDECLAAGMNGHVSKPIQPDELYAALVKWTALKTVRKVPTEAVAVNTKSVLPDRLPGIKIDKVMARINGNGSLLQTILRDFRTQNTSTVADMRHAVAANERRQLLTLAHALKGVSGNIGAESLAATLREFENAVKGDKDALFPELLDRMECQMAEVFEAVSILDNTVIQPVETVHDKKSEVFDKDELGHGLRELYSLLSLNKIAANEKFHRLKSTLPDTEERTVLEKQIAAFDFKGAMTSLLGFADSIGVTIREHLS
ncbi:MAG: response regulator, partial [Desulfuromonadaceae bacterium]|nr:response regulator [Desulfuromonadaceae bacterium]